MKKRITFIFLIMVVVLCISQIAFAENEVPSTAIAASTVNSTSAAPTQTVDNAVYNQLLTKIETKNILISKENQVCNQIKDQENINKAKISTIVEKSQSYSTAYNKIIDDIKLLLEPIKTKEALYIRSVKTGAQSDTSGQEAGIYDNQISGLNMAIKGMRLSMKYISLQSVEYHKKLENAQNNIDSMNQAIDELNKQIIEQKSNKDKEWNNFCSAMGKSDFITASQSYDNMLKIKQDIIQNYNLVLQYKQSIGQQLSTLVD